jgi:hypothetical protein
VFRGERILVSHARIRLDHIGADLAPQGTITTEEDQNDDRIGERLRHQRTQHPDGGWRAVEASEDAAHPRSDRPDVPEHRPSDLDVERA